VKRWAGIAIEASKLENKELKAVDNWIVDISMGKRTNIK
jgi:hypothetical protein